MWAGLFTAIINAILGAFGLQKKGPSVEERLGQAEISNQSQEAALNEVAASIGAERAADAERLRHAPETATTDPNASVNSDDGFRRD